MSEARKYHLNLIVANQFTTQLTDEIRDAVFGNMGTIVAFRVGQNDVDALVKYFQPTFDGEDLLRVPNYNTITRTLVGGVPTQPFSMSTLPPLGNPNADLATALRQLSAAKYGRPRAKVEQNIFARLATKEEPRPTFGGAPPNPFNSNPAGGRPAASRPASGTGSSFLDEWLAKRKVQPGAATATPAQPFASTAPATQNITSSVAQQTEVTSIADELRQTLVDKPQTQAVGGAAEESSTPKASEDTIVIDRDGTLHDQSQKVN
jgi:hypothetical protein